MYCCWSQIRLHPHGTVLCPDRYSHFCMSSFFRIISCVGKSLLTQTMSCWHSYTASSTRLDWVLLCETRCTIQTPSVPCPQDPVGLDVSVSMCLQKMLYLLGIENALGFLGYTNHYSNIVFIFVFKKTIATLCFTETLNKITFIEWKS